MLGSSSMTQIAKRNRQSMRHDTFISGGIVAHIVSTGHADKLTNQKPVQFTFSHAERAEIETANT